MQEVGGQAALLADDILKGDAAGTLPIITASGYLSINRTVAQELGLSVSEDILSQANQVIQ
jgi:ABC-type uncharacterized transport system substrate-binding protein